MVEASASWTEGDRFVGIASSRHALVVDSGTEKLGNGPMELVLIALCACTATDVVTILQKKREPFTEVQVKAEGERAAEPPRVYTSIHLTYRVSGKVSKKAVEDAVRLSEEKYCSVSAMLQKTARITASIEYAP